MIGKIVRWLLTFGPESLDFDCEGLRGTSIQEAVKAGKITFYVGYMHALTEEWRRAERIAFLTEKSRMNPHRPT